MEELPVIIGAAIAEVFVREEAKRTRWVRIMARILGVAGNLLLWALVMGLVYVTIRYS